MSVENDPQRPRKSATKIVRRRARPPEPVVIAEPASIEASEKIFGVDARRAREIQRLVDRVA